jgi:transposase InsO family protein
VSPQADPRQEDSLGKKSGSGKTYPYLLRDLAIDRPNQVWATDIMYIPMARGFVYPVAIEDWFSRRVLSWRISIGMEVDFCLGAVEEALARHGKPEIFNSRRLISCCCWKLGRPVICRGSCLDVFRSRSGRGLPRCSASRAQTRTAPERLCGGGSCDAMVVAGIGNL